MTLQVLDRSDLDGRSLVRLGETCYRGATLTHIYWLGDPKNDRHHKQRRKTAPEGAPALNALVQYLKDFSFENPNAPRSLGPQEKSPNITLQVNVNAQQMSDTDFAVSLLVDVNLQRNVGRFFLWPKRTGRIWIFERKIF